MKIAATTVGTRGPETPAQNQQRLEAARHALRAAKELGSDVLVLPGGYFVTYDHRSGDDMAKSLINEAKKLGLAVLFGADEHNTKPVQLGAKIKAKLQKQTAEWWPDPMYGYAWSPTENKIHCCRQRSISSKDQWSVPTNVCEQVRTFMIGAESLGVLICGEIFNQRIRDALKNHEPKPIVVADLGHIGAGFKIHWGMKALCEGNKGIATMCSLHVQGQNAMKRYCIPGKGYMSTRNSDITVMGPPRIEIKMLEF